MAPLKARLSVLIFLIAAGMALIARPGTALPNGNDLSALRSSPLDRSPHHRPLVAGERQLAGRAAGANAVFSLVDVALGIRNDGPGNEPSVAVDPLNPNRIVVTSFSGDNGADAPVWFSSDAGAHWVQHFSVPFPPGDEIPDDQTVDFGQAGVMYGTFLALGDAIYSGSSADPSQASAWNWNLLQSGQAQKTNLFAPNGVDQPWLLVNRDPRNAGQDRVYVAYDEFTTNSVNLHVASAAGTNPPNFTSDVVVGIPRVLATNPGTRLCVDSRNGWVYVLYEESQGSGATKLVNYWLNRSKDGGRTWSLNGNRFGMIVASRNSDQAPGYKMGGVNALLGGVDHATVDPTTGDVYYVFGARDTQGNNRLQIVRLADDGTGTGNLVADPPHYVGGTGATTGRVTTALPSVAMTTNGTLGVLYQSYDGVSAGFPRFSVHFATSRSQGISWTDNTLISYLSTDTDDGDPRQRVLGDYQQLKALGQTFYGVFPANGATLGQNVGTMDPVFFSALAPDVPLVSFSSPSYAVRAADGSATVTVTRTGNLAIASTVDYATSDQTAISPANYAPANGTITFGPGESTKTFQVQVNDDSLLQGDLSLNLTLQNAVNADLGVPAAAVMVISDDTAVVAPTNLSATVTSATQVQLLWTDNCQNEDGFAVERKANLGTFQTVGSVAANVVQYLDQGLIPGTTYTYRVRAFKFSVNSDYSNTANATITGIQFDASAYTVSETDGTLTVDVLRVGDSSAAASVDFTTADGTATAAGGAPDYGAVTQTLSFAAGETSKTVVIPIVDDNRIEGSETFTVNLANATGANIVLGTPPTAMVTILDDTARTVPTNLTATVVNANQVSLTWNDNSSNESIFSIERQDGAGADFRQIASVTANTTSFNDRSAVPGVQYTYRVRGQVGALTTSYSNTATVTIGTVQFGAPAYTVAETSGTATVTVTRGGDTTGAASVSYATVNGTATAPADYIAANGTINFAPGETSRSIPVQIVDNQLLEGDHAFTLVLSIPNGPGLVLSTGAQTTLTITDDVTGLAPTNLSAQPTSSSTIVLSWSNHCANATSFAIERAIGDGPFGPLAVVAASAGTTYTDTGLAKSQGYIYRVRAANAVGQSAYSNQAGATTLLDPPTAPSGLHGAAISASEIQLFWNDNSNNENGYVLTRTDGNQIATPIALSANTVTYVDGGLIPGQSYKYSVVAISDSGTSSVAGPITITIPAPPRAPANLTAIGIGPNQIRLAWTGSDAGASYTLYRKNGASDYAVAASLAPGTTSYVDATATAGVTYTYQLTASGIGGDSTPSNEVQVVISALGKLQITPKSLNFGRTQVAANTLKTFTLRNTGKGVVSGMVGAPSVGAAFTVTSGGGLFALAPGQALKVTVRFLPRNAGNFSDSLIVSSTDRGHDAVQVNLSGSAR